MNENNLTQNQPPASLLDDPQPVKGTGLLDEDFVETPAPQSQPKSQPSHDTTELALNTRQGMIKKSGVRMLASLARVVGFRSSKERRHH